MFHLTGLVSVIAWGIFRLSPLKEMRYRYKTQTLSACLSPPSLTVPGIVSWLSPKCTGVHSGPSRTSATHVLDPNGPTLLFNPSRRVSHASKSRSRQPQHTTNAPIQPHPQPLRQRHQLPRLRLPRNRHIFALVTRLASKPVWISYTARGTERKVMSNSPGFLLVLAWARSRQC